MKKKAAIFLAVLLLVFAVSCKKEPPSVPTVSTPSSSAPSGSEKPGSSAPSSKGESSSDVSSGQVSRPLSKPEEDPTVTLPEVSPHEEHRGYNFLTDIQKLYYEAMHTAVEEMYSSWIVLGPISANYGADIAVVREALASDHPDIFWLPPYYVTAQGKDSAGNPAALMMFSSSSELSPAYLISRGEKGYMEEELTEAVEEIAEKVTATDPFEIELQLHDLLCERVTYSEDKSDPMIYTSYGALVNGKALCEGYSRAMQLLLHRFGIEATTVTGIAEGAGHMWNLVKIYDGWYNLDVTWNDTASDFISHEYFNITDSEITLDHTFSKDYTEIDALKLAGGTVSFNISRPECSALEADYFVKRGFFFTGEKILALAELMLKSESKIIEIKFADMQAKEDFTKNSLAYLEELNAEIAVANPECSFYIKSASVSSLTVRFYKTEKDESSSHDSSLFLTAYL